MKQIDSFEPEKYQACLGYILSYWEKIICHQINDDGTLIGLPFHYVRPNHIMFKEQYYWDSYFIALGLEGSDREHLVVELTENLVYLMARFGRVPNASRYYYLSRSQPPFLSSLVLKSYALLKRSGEPHEKLMAWLKEKFEIVKKEYIEVWRGKVFPDQREVFRGLSRYYDLNIWHNAAEAESGWDMTPRFYDRCLDFLPIDLNCLLFQYERDFVWMSEILGDYDDSKKWHMLLEQRRQNIYDLMWDEEKSFFYDYDFRHQTRSKFTSLAGFFSLWSELASPNQAALIVKNRLPEFETQYGLVTGQEWHRVEDEPMRQWSWPNGWAPLHWIVISGLLKYGYEDEARRLSLKWVNLVNDIFSITGKVYEKYDVVRGTRAVPDRYPDQEGFGWTNAVFVRLLRYLKTGQLWGLR
jgi:alpha,alpha-trehalase